MDILKIRTLNSLLNEDLKSDIRAERLTSVVKVANDNILVPDDSESLKPPKEPLPTNQNNTPSYSTKYYKNNIQ